MNPETYFTQWELDFALSYLQEQMEWHMDEMSIEHDAGDKLEKLKKKLDHYFHELRNEA
jgi:hypothetical protein